LEDNPDLDNNTKTDATEKKENKTENKPTKTKKIEKIQETDIEKKIETKTKPQEPKKPEKKHKEPKQKKDAKKQDSDDFRYIVRIANTDINGDQRLVHGLTTIKGIGMHLSSLIINELGLNKNIKIGNLSDSQIDIISNFLSKIAETAPPWMLNHRKDFSTGENIHLIGSDIDMRLRDEINIMKKIRCYKGIRHERGLTVRGQRTRANSRKGLTLGVSKKRT
jgi:small subunit ribosomal protein S13